MGSDSSKDSKEKQAKEKAEIEAAMKKQQQASQQQQQRSIDAGSNSTAAGAGSPTTTQQSLMAPANSSMTAAGSTSANPSLVSMPSSQPSAPMFKPGEDPMAASQSFTGAAIQGLPQAVSVVPTAPGAIPSGGATGSNNRRPPPLRLTREAIAATAHNWTKGPIGHGGFSTVYEGVFYNAPVAVKVLAIRNHDEKLMFDEELKAMINPALQHEYILPLLGYCDTHPAFIFPKMKPLSKDRLARLPLDVRDFVCMDVALGLGHMHSAGFIHSDMKPDNILLEFDNNRQIVKAVVGDMGCVKSTSVPVPVFGTIVFLDPTLPTDGRPVLPQPSHDVYSLGVTFLSIFCTHIPGSREEIMQMLNHLDTTDPGRAHICRRMMHPDPNQRPSCAQLAQEFKDMMNSLNASRGQASAYFPKKDEVVPTPAPASGGYVPPQQQQQQPPLMQRQVSAPVVGGPVVAPVTAPHPASAIAPGHHQPGHPQQVFVAPHPQQQPSPVMVQQQQQQFQQQQMLQRGMVAQQPMPVQQQQQQPRMMMAGQPQQAPAQQQNKNQWGNRGNV